MEDVHGHEWSTELNSPFADDRDASPYCVYCGYRTWTTRANEPCTKARPAPKPATPEPPEWVSGNGVTIPAGTLGPGYAVRIEGTATWKNGHVGKVDVRVVSAETIDPVTDFIARRVAKREVSNTIPTTAEPWDSRPQSVVTDEALSRAMSQPGPHDTPMRTRLMPYRGVSDTHET